LVGYVLLKLRLDLFKRSSGILYDVDWEEKTWDIFLFHLDQAHTSIMDDYDFKLVAY